MHRASELLSEIISLFKHFSPNWKSDEELRFQLSNGPCYHIAHAVSHVLFNEGYEVYLNSHGHHCWLYVDGKAYDTLVPEGYSGSMWDYWHMDKMFMVDKELGKGILVTEGMGHEVLRHLEGSFALREFCKKYQLDYPKTFPRDTDRYGLRRMERKASKLNWDKLPKVTDLKPVQPFTAYFYDCLEEDFNGFTRRLTPYPYKMSLSETKMRRKEFLKKNIRYYQM